MRRSSHVLTTSRASSGWHGSLRESRGAASAYENPRCHVSTCIELMPRSMRTTSARTPSASSDSRPAAKSVRMKRVAQLTSAASSVKRSSATGSRSRPMSSPSGPRRSAMSRAWPPPPTVQSMATSPGRGSSRPSASSARTGSCVAVMSSRLTKLRSDVGDLVGEGAVVGGPRRPVPDLQAVLGTHHDDLLAEAGVLEQERGDAHAAGGVELGVERVGREERAELAPLRRKTVEALQRLCRERPVLRWPPQFHAPLEALGQHDAVAQRRPELGRDGESVLRIQRVVEGATKGHRKLMSSRRREAGVEEWEEPLHSGLLVIFYPTLFHKATQFAHDPPPRSTR